MLLSNRPALQEKFARAPLVALHAAEQSIDRKAASHYEKISLQTIASNARERIHWVGRNLDFLQQLERSPQRYQVPPLALR